MSNGISKQTFECFVCKKQGFNERVYLAGKDSNGRTIYLEPDGVTAHHKFKEKTVSSNPTTLATTADEIISLLKEIDEKLNRLLAIEGQ